MKAQSQIYQFVLFFLIGLSVFGIVGNFYKNQALTLRDRINKASSNLYISSINSNIIKYYLDCRDCNSSEFYMKFPNSTAGYYYIFSLSTNPKGVSVSIPETGEKYFSSIHNLNYSLETQTSDVPSVKTLNFSYIKKTNNLILVGK